MNLARHSGAGKLHRKCDLDPDLAKYIVHPAWYGVRGAFLRNRDPDPEKLQAALDSGEPPPADISDKVEKYLDPNNSHPPGNRPIWNEKAELRWIHLFLRCLLVDRIRGDGDVAARLNAGKRVSFREACRWVECLPEQHLARLWRSPDLAEYLVRANVTAAENSGKTTQQHYYTYHDPSPAILERIRIEINKRLSAGMDIWEAADEVSKTGLYPERRRSNSLRLPLTVIHGHYLQAKHLFGG